MIPQFSNADTSFFSVTDDGLLTLHSDNLQDSAYRTGFIGYKNLYPSTTVQKYGYSAAFGSDTIQNTFCSVYCVSTTTDSLTYDLEHPDFGAIADGDYWFSLFSLDTGAIAEWYPLKRESGVWSTTADFSFFTRVINVFPVDVDVSTSTSVVNVGWSHYVSADDYVDDIKVVFRAYNVSAYQSVSVADMLDAQGGFTSFLTGSTTQSMYATTTVILSSGDGGGSYDWDMTGLPTGRYIVQATMYIPEQPPEGFWESTKYYVKKSWGNIMRHLENIDGVPNSESQTRYNRIGYFTYGELSYYDTQYDLVSNTKQAFRNCDVSLSVFSWFSSDSSLLDCMNVFFIPTDQQLSDLWNTIVDSILSVFPLGYVTRTVTIFNNTPATAPPDIVYTYGLSAPTEIQGKGFSMDIWSQFYLLNDTIKSDRIDNQKTIWQIVEPYFQMMVALAVWSMILYDVISLGLPDFGGGFNFRADELEGEYRTSGSVSISQLPDQPSPNKVSYGSAMSVRIHNRRGQRNIPREMSRRIANGQSLSKSLIIPKYRK